MFFNTLFGPISIFVHKVVNLFVFFALMQLLELDVLILEALERIVFLMYNACNLLSFVNSLQFVLTLGAIDFPPMRN